MELGAKLFPQPNSTIDGNVCVFGGGYPETIPVAWVNRIRWVEGKKYADVQNNEIRLEDESVGLTPFFAGTAKLPERRYSKWGGEEWRWRQIIACKGKRRGSR